MSQKFFFKYSPKEEVCSRLYPLRHPNVRGAQRLVLSLLFYFSPSPLFFPPFLSATFARFFFSAIYRTQFALFPLSFSKSPLLFLFFFCFQILYSLLLSFFFFFLFLFLFSFFLSLFFFFPFFFLFLVFSFSFFFFSFFSFLSLFSFLFLFFFLFFLFLFFFFSFFLFFFVIVSLWT